MMYGEIGNSSLNQGGATFANAQMCASRETIARQLGGDVGREASPVENALQEARETLAQLDHAVSDLIDRIRPALAPAAVQRDMASQVNRAERPIPGRSAVVIGVLDLRMQAAATIERIISIRGDIEV